MRTPETSAPNHGLAKENVKFSERARDTACEPPKRNDKEVKSQQARKIRELGDALVLEGFLTLDQQAEALGLCRSTAWTILKANHKASGLSAAVINSMLAAPRLPCLVRDKILEYIDEKTDGSYGHNKTQVHRFTARLSKDSEQVRTKNTESHETFTGVQAAIIPFPCARPGDRRSLVNELQADGPYGPCEGPPNNRKHCNRSSVRSLSVHHLPIKEITPATGPGLSRQDGSLSGGRGRAIWQKGLRCL
jgi:hypothetical protein